MPPRTGRRWYEQSFVYLTAIYAGVLGGLLAASAGASWLLALPYVQSLLVVLGAFVLVATYVKPWWFWDYYEAFVLRALVGDRAASWIYAGLGTALVWLGLAVTLPRQ
jgi:hypothetical protein